MSESSIDINCWAMVAAIVLGLGAIIWQIFRSEKRIKNPPAA